MEVSKGAKYSMSVWVSEFAIPPVSDGLVLGKDAPIGFAAINKALSLLIADNMQNIEVEDDVISHIIVRHGILRRVPEDRFVAFVLNRVKPLMCIQDILHLQIDAEVIIEEGMRLTAREGSPRLTFLWPPVIIGLLERNPERARSCDSRCSCSLNVYDG